MTSGLRSTQPPHEPGQLTTSQRWTLKDAGIHRNYYPLGTSYSSAKALARMGLLSRREGMGRVFDLTDAGRALVERMLREPQ